MKTYCSFCALSHEEVNLMVKSIDHAAICDSCIGVAIESLEGADVWMRSIHESMAEIKKAVAKFPEWPTDPLHALAILGEEYGELSKAIVQLTYEPHKTSMDEVKTEAIQTAAMALRFLASIDQYQFKASEQHKQEPR